MKGRQNLFRTWKEDLNLREKLNDYVTEGLRREEILDFMLRDFDCYAWSIRTLDRRLRYYDIIYTKTDVAVTAWLQSNAEKAKPSS